VSDEWIDELWQQADTSGWRLDRDADAERDAAVVARRVANASQFATAAGSTFASPSGGLRPTVQSKEVR
jgi:hypothetical protein